MYGFVNVHCNTRFFVVNDYEAMDSDTSVKATQQAIDEFYKDNQYKYSYNPLEDAPELYLELAKVETDKKKSLLKFVKNYGLPYETEKINYIDYYKLIFLSMDLDGFYSELDTYKTILNMWDNINSKDEEELKKVKAGFSHAANIFQMRSQLGVVDDYLNATDQKKVDTTIKTSEKSHGLWEDWEQVKGESLETIAKTFMIFLLNSRRTGKNQFEVVNGEIKPTIHFSNLFEVAYYQLSQAMVNNIELKHCKHCGSLFEPIHGHQKFCSPRQANKTTGKNKKRSSCENAYNQKLKRQRKKEVQ